MRRTGLKAKDKRWGGSELNTWWAPLKALMIFWVLDNEGISSWAENLTKSFFRSWSRDNSVHIAARYGLDGPGIESRFSAPVQTGAGAHPSSYTMGSRYYPGVKGQGQGPGVDHLLSCSAEVKERVELYLYSPSGPSWPVLGWTLLYFFRR